MDPDRWPWSENKLRDALRRLRELLDFTQEQMARHMGTTVRTIARWETAADSLPFGVLMRLRHAAIEADDEDLAEYFHTLALATGPPDEPEAAVAIYDFLPGNLKEMRIVAEVLRRMRADDPAIDPAIRHVEELIQERQAREEEERRKIAQQRASQPPRPKLRDKLLARRARERKEREEKGAKADEEKGTKTPEG